MLVRWCALLAFACPCAVRAAQSFPGEKIEFVSEVRGRQEPVYGYLSMPQADRPLPAMILVHGSGGIGDRELRYTAEYNRMGIAVFAIDSFTPRGVTSTALDQASVSAQQMEADAFAALRLIGANPRIDRGRIGIQGVSKGGTVALETALPRVARARGAPADLKFALHVPLYPGCSTQYRTPVTSGAPILMLLGAKDDYVGAEPCRNYAEVIKNGGADIRVIVYPEAEHGFDGNDGQRIRIDGAQNYSKCLAYIEDDGRIIDAKTGQLIDSQRRFNELMAGCMTRGASLATDGSAKAQSLEAIRLLFSQTLLKR